MNTDWKAHAVLQTTAISHILYSSTENMFLVVLKEYTTIFLTHSV